MGRSHGNPVVYVVEQRTQEVDCVFTHQSYDGIVEPKPAKSNRIPVEFRILAFSLQYLINYINRREGRRKRFRASAKANAMKKHSEVEASPPV